MRDPQWHDLPFHVRFFIVVALLDGAAWFGLLVGFLLRGR